MTKRRSEVFEVLRCIVLVVFLLNLMAIVPGLMESLMKFTGCNEPRTRIGYIMPGFRIGCWLGEVP